MDHREVGRMWNENAKVWAPLVRQGYDIYRDHLNTPAFLAMLPKVEGLAGLDIGCGEGANTRHLARLGAKMTGIDIAEVFIRYASETEDGEPLGIDYRTASAVELPFEDGSFDFATAFMSLMDMPEPDKAVQEASRVLRPGGFLQFSILHPCFATPRWRWVLDEAGERVGVVCGDYFTRRDGRIEEWLFGAAPEELRRTLRKFRVPRFFRTLSEWMNTLLDAGLTPERFAEPTADAETIRRYPGLADTRIVASFLIVRCRKAG